VEISKTEVADKLKRKYDAQLKSKNEKNKQRLRCLELRSKKAELMSKRKELTDSLSRKG
jgi:hypothetical protein